MYTLNSKQFLENIQGMTNCHLCRSRIASVECKSCGTNDSPMKLCFECDILLHKTSLKLHQRSQIGAQQKVEKKNVNNFIEEKNRTQNISSIPSFNTYQNTATGFLTSRDPNFGLINIKSNEKNLQKNLENENKKANENLKEYMEILTNSYNDKKNQFDDKIYELTKSHEIFQRNMHMKVD